MKGIIARNRKTIIVTDTVTEKERARFRIDRPCTNNIFIIKQDRNTEIS